MEVKAVKAVTEVTLALTGDEASMLREILLKAVEYSHSTEIGRFAMETNGALAECDIEASDRLKDFDPETGEWHS